ncbi:MAG TPA: hypothetical protein VJ962_07695 [Clostridia bacterium]|nr:hypothetical protein [Clostridia bacterium]
MDDKKATIYNAFLEDPTLKSIIRDRLYFFYNKNNAVYPQITYFKIDDLGDYSYGDCGDISNLYYQIEAWDDFENGSNIPSMDSSIDKVMNELGFHRTYSFIGYDDKSKIYRLVMRYEGLIKNR